MILTENFLQIQSPYDLDLARENTLMTLRMSTINKNSQDISTLERFHHERPLYLLNVKADFMVDKEISMPRHYTGCKKRRYLRNQILDVRNVLSDEEWLRYAELRFGSTVRYEPFLTGGFHKVS